MLPKYHAAQWTTFAFGIFATTLGLLFFRGVGVVGHRSIKVPSISENEKGKPISNNSNSAKCRGYRNSVTAGSIILITAENKAMFDRDFEPSIVSTIR